MEYNRSKPSLLTKSEFARAINAKPSYVSALTRSEPKIKVTIENNIQYIDTDNYPIKDWKKRGSTGKKS
jgi:hypothetical protein